MRTRWWLTFERLSVEPITPELHAQIHKLRHAIADHPVEILPDVPATLEYLSQRHHLIMVTKGAIAEQIGKIERSGLKDYFAAVEIVAEKDVATYRSMVSQVRAFARQHLDDRQQPEIRYQSRAGRWA